MSAEAPHDLPGAAPMSCGKGAPMPARRGCAPSAAAAEGGYGKKNALRRVFALQTQKRLVQYRQSNAKAFTEDAFCGARPPQRAAVRCDAAGLPAGYHLPARRAKSAGKVVLRAVLSTALPTGAYDGMFWWSLCFVRKQGDFFSGKKEQKPCIRK